MSNRPSINRAQIPAYLNAVAQLAGKLKPGTVNHVVVEHDDHCPLLLNGGACTCQNPTVTLCEGQA